MRKIEDAQGRPVAFLDEERAYVQRIGSMNAQIHLQLIGGDDSPDPLCLHRTFCAARASVNAFEHSLQPPPFPLWYLVIHFTAIAAVIKGAILAIHWLGLA
jgi:hypothetical protein